MSIVIIAAMEDEITSLRNRLHNVDFRTMATNKLYSGDLCDQRIHLIVSGVGKVNAAIATTLAIHILEPKAVISIGVAGGLHSSVKLGDVVIASELCYHDVNVMAFGYQYGQVPNTNPRFSSDGHLIKAALSYVVDQDSEIKVHKGLILSGDSFISEQADATRIQQYFPEALACEMESSAIAHVCHQFNVSCLTIRSISDIPGENNASVFEESMQKAEKSYIAPLLHVLKKYEKTTISKSIIINA